MIVAFGIYGEYSKHSRRRQSLADHFAETFIFKGQPLMPPRLFKKLGYVSVVICAAIGAMVYYSLTIIWPTMVATLFTADIMQIGWKSCVVGGGILLGQIIGGIYLAVGPKVKWMTIFASAVGGAMTASLAAAKPDGENAAIAQAILALVFVGIVENITFPGVTLLVEDQDIGVAAGVLGSIRGMAGAIAQALYVSILTNKSSQYLASYVPPAATGAGLPASAVPAVFDGIAAGSFDAVPGITNQIIVAVGAAVQRAYNDAFYWTFIAAIPFGKFCLVNDQTECSPTDVATQASSSSSPPSACRTSKCTTPRTWRRSCRDAAPSRMTRRWPGRRRRQCPPDGQAHAFSLRVSLIVVTVHTYFCERDFRLTSPSSSLTRYRPTSLAFRRLKVGEAPALACLNLVRVAEGVCSHLRRVGDRLRLGRGDFVVASVVRKGVANPRVPLSSSPPVLNCILST